MDTIGPVTIALLTIFGGFVGGLTIVLYNKFSTDKQEKNSLIQVKTQTNQEVISSSMAQRKSWSRLRISLQISYLSVQNPQELVSL